MINDSIQSVTQRIARSCNKALRPFDSVKLVCVTKTASVKDIEEALDAGVRIIGENRVQDAMAKHAAIGERCEWHLIGHLQTNKVKDAVRIFSLIHSVDSQRLADKIDDEARKLGKVQDILVQVNVSGEKSKFGIEPGGAEALVKQASSYKSVRLRGLMTIAPETDDPEAARPYFRALRELRDRLGIEGLLLSMGMTGDFEVAIEEGSDFVRVGRAIFS